MVSALGVIKDDSLDCGPKELENQTLVIPVGPRVRKRVKQPDYPVGQAGLVQLLMDC